MNEKPENEKKLDVEKNANVKDKSYQFSSENQPKRRRGKDRKRKILQAIEDHGLTEPEFLRTVVANAIEGDQKCMEHVLRSLFPLQRPMLPSFSLDVDKNQKTKKNQKSKKTQTLRTSRTNFPLKINRNADGGLSLIHISEPTRPY